MDKFTIKTIEFSLNKLFQKSYFCICDMDNLLKITRATKLPSYDLLRAYHCVDFEEMDQETRGFVMQATIDNVCNVQGFPQIILQRPEGKPVAEVVNTPSIGRRLRTALTGA